MGNILPCNACCFFSFSGREQIHQMLDKMFDVHPAGTSIFIAAFVFENDCVTFRG
jgi:hypothetical protein